MTAERPAPLFIQRDMTVLLETAHPEFEQVRELLSRFAELVKSPNHVHTYRITPYSLWGAAASGWKADDIADTLRRYSRYGLPEPVRETIADYVGRYGKLRLEAREGKLLLLCTDDRLLDRLQAYSSLSSMFRGRFIEYLEVVPECRGLLKQELIRLWHPVVDEAGFHAGEALDIRLDIGRDGFFLRPYQEEAVEAFYREGSRHGGSGVIVLPCGAGKTVVGIAVMSRLRCATLILTTNVASVRQWKREIAFRTGLPDEQIGEYSGERKEVRPVTVATYQILTHRKDKDEPYRHMQLFAERDWGLVIYDEVHLLPAPVFRITADIQATRRLGLTATLVREDGREEDVFALVGPKRYETGWKQLEHDGWIARVNAAELRVPLPPAVSGRYETAGPKTRFRLAAENPRKLDYLEDLLDRHAERPALVIGQYLGQLKAAAARLGAPLITGETSHQERERLYSQFRLGEIKRLIVSKVANFAVDLPEASVAVELSGSFGSRQEEAQRLGRVLRPKRGDNTAFFYTMVSRNTVEQEFARKRQLFLVEQGYRYETVELGGEDE